MTLRTNPPKPLNNPPIPVRARIAAAWTSFMFLVIYVDLYHLFQPGEIDKLRGGTIFVFEVSATLMTLFFVIIAVPSLMVLLSMTLPARVNRTTNLVIAAIFIPICVFNAVGESSEWALYYAVTIGVEVLILAFILRSAWTWPRTIVVAADGPTR